MQWHGRLKHRKMRILAVVAVSAGLLPVAGSFVPRDSGNVLFGDVAQAACKRGLSNDFRSWWFNAKVVTDWCYRNGHVTRRSSIAHGRVTNWGVVAGWFYYRFSWTYSKCHRYNGYWNHNCLTQGRFSLFNGHTGTNGSICINTRIYGNGAHRRSITKGPGCH